MRRRQSRLLALLPTLLALASCSVHSLARLQNHRLYRSSSGLALLSECPSLYWTFAFQSAAVQIGHRFVRWGAGSTGGTESCS